MRFNDSSNRLVAAVNLYHAHSQLISRQQLSESSVATNAFDNVMHSRQLYTTIIGDAGSPAVHSGMHYYFYEAARSIVTDLRPIKLCYDSPLVRLNKYGWAASQLLLARKPRGYQFTNHFLERIWRPVRRSLAGSGLINFFQLYPTSIIHDPSISVWFYIDLTLQQLFEFYGLGREFSSTNMEDTRRRELSGYLCARRIFTMSQFAANSLINDYGIDPNKVQVALPGANIPADLLSSGSDPEPTCRPAPGPFVVGFVGKDWKRKGLDRLMRAVAIARERGADIRLRVIGPTANEVPHDGTGEPCIEWAGAIDKRTDAAHFVNQLRGCDLGCLLSWADASPLALREFQALGVPTLSTDVGACRELAHPSASLCVSVDATDDAIADYLVKLALRDEPYSAMKHNAWANRAAASWQFAAGTVMANVTSTGPNSIHRDERRSRVTRF